MSRIVRNLAFILLLPCLLTVLQANSVVAAPVTSLDQVHVPQATKTILEYSRIRYALVFFSILYSVVLLLLIMQTRISARMRDIAIRSSRRKAVQIIIYSVLLTLIVALCTLPLTYFSGYYIEHKFTLSQQSLSSFFIDKLKALGVSAVIDAIVLLVFFGVVGRFRKHWPTVLWLISIPAVALTIFAEPIIIDPIFNEFTPMEAGSLKTKITDLATRAGIPNATILVADKSKQTNKMNAYVTGLGNSSRIVLWDSTIKRLPEDEVLSVVGHETGHYVLHHIYWGYALTIVGFLIFVPLAYLFSNRLIAALPRQWEVGSLSDYAVTPVLMCVMIASGFVLMPLVNFYSRYQEHQADRYGLEITGNRLAMANLFIRFAENNLSEPNPPRLIKFFLFTHPTLKERIEFAAGRKLD